MISKKIDKDIFIFISLLMFLLTLILVNLYINYQTTKMAIDKGYVQKVSQDKIIWVKNKK